MLFCFQAQVLWADEGCNNPDTSQCTEWQSYWLKLENVYDIDIGEVSGKDVLERTAQPVAVGKPFCAVAYYDSNPRTLRNYALHVIGPQRNSSFVLKQGDNKRLPVTLRLTGNTDANSSIRNRSLFNNLIRVSGQNTYSLCRDYNFTIAAEVSRNDILQAMAIGKYQGTFSLIVGSRAGNWYGQSVAARFVVSISISPAYRVSRLEDVHLSQENLTSDGQWYMKDLEFCVFAMGGQHYKMTVNSQLRPSGRFELRNGSSGIPYRVSVLQGRNNWKVFQRGGSTDSRTLSGSEFWNCDGSTNALLRIDMQSADASGKSSGTYSDVMEVTVGPE